MFAVMMQYINYLHVLNKESVVTIYRSVENGEKGKTMWLLAHSTIHRTVCVVRDWSAAEGGEARQLEERKRSKQRV